MHCAQRNQLMTCTLHINVCIQLKLIVFTDPNNPNKISLVDIVTAYILKFASHIFFFRCCSYSAYTQRLLAIFFIFRLMSFRHLILFVINARARTNFISFAVCLSPINACILHMRARLLIFVRWSIIFCFVGFGFNIRFLWYICLLRFYAHELRDGQCQCNVANTVLLKYLIRDFMILRIGKLFNKR